MPVCLGCGGSYEDNFKFCPYCGRTKPDQNSLKVQYEICQIEGAQVTKGLGEFFGRTFRFWADAVSPKGKYTVATHDWREGAYHDFSPDGNCQKRVQAHSEFIRKLTDDGWETSEEREIVWYQLRFRRQVSGK